MLHLEVPTLVQLLSDSVWPERVFGGLKASASVCDSCVERGRQQSVCPQGGDPVLGLRLGDRGADGLWAWKAQRSKWEYCKSQPALIFMYNLFFPFFLSTLLAQTIWRQPLCQCRHTQTHTHTGTHAEYRDCSEISESKNLGIPCCRHTHTPHCLSLCNKKLFVLVNFVWVNPPKGSCQMTKA